VRYRVNECWGNLENRDVIRMVIARQQCSRIIPRRSLANRVAAPRLTASKANGEEGREREREREKGNRSAAPGNTETRAVNGNAKELGSLIKRSQLMDQGNPTSSQFAT